MNRRFSELPDLCVHEVLTSVAWCRAMPEELAASASLQEIDVGYNKLTAMPQMWISGNASQSPVAYIGMDNNDIDVGFLLPA